MSTERRPKACESEARSAASECRMRPQRPESGEVEAVLPRMLQHAPLRMTWDRARCYGKMFEAVGGESASACGLLTPLEIVTHEAPAYGGGYCVTVLLP